MTADRTLNTEALLDTVYQLQVDLLSRDRLKTALKKWCYDNGRPDRVFNAKTRT